MLNKGFVYVTGTKYKGRFARFVKISEYSGKCRVMFGFEGEEAEYGLVNYADISERHLVNDFNFSNLLDRYYQLKADLRAIYRTAHKEIAPRSKEHWSLVSEYNIVRMLMDRYLSVEKFTVDNKEKNVAIAFDYKDRDVVYDLIEELEISGYTVAAYSHDLTYSVIPQLKEIMENCRVLIYVLSENIIKSPYYEQEICKLTEYIEIRKAFFVVINGITATENEVINIRDIDDIKDRISENLWVL